MKRQQKSFAERQATVAGYRSSGLTQREYCKREGINFHSLQWWIQSSKGGVYAVCGVESSGDDRTPKLLPVRLSEHKQEQQEALLVPMQVEVGGGVILRFCERNDSSYVARLLRELSMGSGVSAC